VTHLQSQARARQGEPTAARGWRDHIKVHPAADLFPMMSEPQLRELGEDIKKNKQRVQVIFWIPSGRCRASGGPEMLIDGRNRLDAMEMVGLPVFDKNGVQAFNWRYMEGDPYDLVLSLNINRRHLDEEERRDLIAKVIKAKPEASDRAIAKQVKRDHKTVAKVRKKMESTGEVSPVETRVGADGKARKQPKAGPKKTPKSKPVSFTHPDVTESNRKAGSSPPRPESEPRAGATGSAEVSIEQRRADMAHLEEPAEEISERVNCVANTIRRQVDGLSRSGAERFFTTLRDCVDVLELALRAGLVGTA